MAFYLFKLLSLCIVTEDPAPLSQFRLNIQPVHSTALG